MFLKGILHKTLGDPGGILGDPGGSCEQAGPTQHTKTEVSCILARGIRLTCECVIILKAKLRCPSSPPEGFQNFKGGAGDENGQPIRNLKERGARTGSAKQGNGEGEANRKTEVEGA